ncbi:MAG: Fic family protein, partial [Thermomonas sp.]
MNEGRYNVDSSEGAFQPGSRGRVLANSLGIVRVRDMEVAETHALLDLTAAHSPCEGMDDTRLLAALARTHAELILIHPFREGNGRLARLLNTLMALQAGLLLLDFDGLRGQAKRNYIGAIHAALSGNYEPMERVFSQVLRRT